MDWLGEFDSSWSVGHEDDAAKEGLEERHDGYPHWYAADGSLA